MSCCAGDCLLSRMLTILSNTSLGTAPCSALYVHVYMELCPYSMDSWSPRNVLVGTMHPAKFLKNGQVGIYTDLHLYVTHTLTLTPSHPHTPTHPHTRLPPHPHRWWRFPRGEPSWRQQKTRASSPTCPWSPSQTEILSSTVTCTTSPRPTPLSEGLCGTAGSVVWCWGCRGWGC